MLKKKNIHNAESITATELQYIPLVVVYVQVVVVSMPFNYTFSSLFVCIAITQNCRFASPALQNASLTSSIKT